MTDLELLTAFEDTTLPASAFHHRDHLRVAWICLALDPPLQALERFSSSLRRYAAAQGATGLYHETITWAFLFLIAQRRAQGPADQTWTDFAARNADLLTWKPSILDRYYQPETLASDLARSQFVLPDLAAG